jgi:hypothetical protein
LRIPYSPKIKENGEQNIPTMLLPDEKQPNMLDYLVTYIEGYKTVEIPLALSTKLAISFTGPCQNFLESE